MSVAPGVSAAQSSARVGAPRRRHAAAPRLSQIPHFNIPDGCSHTIKCPTGYKITHINAGTHWDAYLARAVCGAAAACLAGGRPAGCTHLPA